MKKLVSAVSAFLMSAIFSVTAFARAPSLFEETTTVINTGGEGGIFVIIAIVAAVLAVIGGIVFFLTGKKE